MPPAAPSSRTMPVVLVEGESDRAAVLALAARLGQELAPDAVVSLGGATNIARALAHYGRPGLDVAVGGLCDAAEEGYFRRGLERTGHGPVATRRDLARHGYFVCDTDLEDELIRALGAAAVQDVIEAAGDTRSWRAMRGQPAQRTRTVEAQLHRFLGTTSGRKARYAALLVDALPLAAMPTPLQRVLARLSRPGNT